MERHCVSLVFLLVQEMDQNKEQMKRCACICMFMFMCVRAFQVLDIAKSLNYARQMLYYATISHVKSLYFLKAK